MSHRRPYTVVFDGDCRVCSGTAARLARWDRFEQLEIVPYQQAGVQERFPWIPAAAYAASMQLIRADGRTWQGAAAIEELLRILRRGRPVSWIFRIPFVRPIAERLYRWFARNRYRFGCGDHCPVPAPGTRSRE